MVITILKSIPHQPMKGAEIAAAISEKYSDYCAQKAKNTTQANFDVIKQIAAEISANSKNWMAHYPELKCSDETPRTYWWEENNEGNDDGHAPILQALPTSALKEQELYALLASYLSGMPTRTIYPKRISEGKSSNTKGKNGNRHLHPDLVAMEDLMPTDSNLWSEKVRVWASKAGAPKTKLWSFEVKVNLDSVAEAREGFLQALANSSWANFGYLVASHISDKAFSELKVLHDLHGIGVILLDVDNPIDETVIKLPARERPQLDWGTCNRIANQNKDFKDFIRLVADFHTLHTTHLSDWDIPALPAMGD